MSRGNQEITGGRFTHYGPRGLDQKYGAAQSRVGNDTSLVYEFDYNDLPAANADLELPLSIPANSLILEATVTALVAATGAGPLVVAHVTPANGSPVELISATTANLDTAGKTVVGAGAGVGAITAGVRQIRATGTLTAGKFKVYIKYRAPEDDAAGVKSY